MVKDPVAATFATGLPLIVPKSMLEMTAIFAGPPFKCPQKSRRDRVDQLAQSRREEQRCKHQENRQQPGEKADEVSQCALIHIGQHHHGGLRKREGVVAEQSRYVMTHKDIAVSRPTP